MESCKNDFLCTLPDKLWYRERVDDVAVLGNFITALLAEKMTLTTFFLTRVILRNTNLRLKIGNHVSLEVQH